MKRYIKSALAPAAALLISLASTSCLNDHEQETYHIVGKQEADLAKQKISFDSPLGQALLHKTAGTTVTVEAPQSSYKVKIVKVEL